MFFFCLFPVFVTSEQNKIPTQTQPFFCVLEKRKKQLPERKSLRENMVFFVFVGV